MTCRGSVLFCTTIIGMPSLVKGQDPEQLAAFRRLEQTWERHYAELRKRRAADLLRAYQNYVQMIEPLQRQWTQAGDIEAALSVQQERRRIEQLPERAQPEADAAWDPPPGETAPVDPSATGLPGLTIFQANIEVLILNTALNARQVRQLHRILGGR